MGKTRQDPRHAGFTLVEVTAVLAIAIPLLTGIAITTINVNRTSEANQLSADVMMHCRRTSQRIATLVRPAKLATLEVQATADDVESGRATAVGEWIGPTEDAWRPGIRFRAASGLLSMNAALSTELRSIVFVLDPREKANGTDDDGDGLVDEGSVRLEQNGISFAVLRDVEECRFTLEQRTLLVRLWVARRGTDGWVYRTFLERRFFVRNN